MYKIGDLVADLYGYNGSIVDAVYNKDGWCYEVKIAEDKSIYRYDNELIKK